MYQSSKTPHGFLTNLFLNIYVSSLLQWRQFTVTPDKLSLPCAKHWDVKQVQIANGSLSGLWIRPYLSSGVRKSRERGDFKIVSHSFFTLRCLLCFLKIEERLITFGADILSSSKIGLLRPQSPCWYGSGPAWRANTRRNQYVQCCQSVFFLCPLLKTTNCTSCHVSCQSGEMEISNRGACDRSVYHTCADTDTNH